MSTTLLDAAMSPAPLLVVKVSLLLGAAGCVAALLRRRTSAATRHLVWNLALVGALAIPIASIALPGWTFAIGTAPKGGDATPGIDRGSEFVAIPSTPPSVTVNEGTPAASAGRFNLSWPALIGAVYLGGVAVMLIALFVQRSSVRRCARRAIDVRDPEWSRLLAECSRAMGVRREVRLLRSREQSMPMTFGTRRPSILIPAIAETWSGDRRRAVILHELAHIARRDCLTQTLAFVACTLYWFHPAVWWVTRQLRIERELACDDRVIVAGTQPREYAGHLLEIAYAFGDHRVSAMAVSMARPQQLESRMLAALDDGRNRTVPAPRARAAGILVAAALLLGIAGATPTVGYAAASAPEGERLGTTEAASQPARPLPRLLTDLRHWVHSVMRTAANAIQTAAQENLPGTWDLRPTEKEGVVHLRITELNSSNGSNVPVDQLEGLTAAQLAGAGGPVQFRIRRDAGTFTFEGVLRNRVAAGTFSFAPNPSFPAELAKRGFAQPTAREQYQMARHDIGFAYIDELNKQGYAKPPTAELVRAGQHGVNVTYLREMGALGYRLGSLEPLITLRDHGVTPDYVRGLADLGYKQLPADDLRKARDHGITPEYVRGMRDSGYSSLTMDALVKARDHGVTPEYVRELGEAGHRKLPLEELIRVRDHGVGGEYARDMRQLGYAAPIDELVRARDHGVTVEYAREMAALGYTNLTLDNLIRARDHGVTPDYARAVKALGYDRLAVEDLVMLRDQGLTAERIRAANDRAGTRLPIDLLKSLAR
jgi:beta-lactamase regulating signal transducer with metallopeptidase domain